MRSLLAVLLLLLLVTPAVAVMESFGPKYDQVVEFFQSQEEPEALDAIWASRELLKIGVFSQDKSYDEYAGHACDVLRERGLSGESVQVQIIDLASLIHNEGWKVVGKQVCR